MNQLPFIYKVLDLIQEEGIDEITINENILDEGSII